MKKRSSIFLLLLLPAGFIFSQTTFSLASNFTFLRSFKKQQQFWAVGQSIIGHFHITPKDGAYVWLAYTTNGKFKNNLSATAKSVATTPQEIPFTNRADMKFQHVSIGWKHYLKGASDNNKWNLYGYTGLGLMLGQIINTQSATIDSADYSLPVLPGKAGFKRLTFDVGLGAEVPLGADVFMYFEGRAIIPTTDYPSDHILINKDAPLTGSLNLGIRILIY